MMAEPIDTMPPPLPLPLGEVQPSSPPIDQRHLHEKRLFEMALRDVGIPWSDVYGVLVGRGWKWRRAAIVAWLSMPKKERIPATRRELADMLGCNVATIGRIEDMPDVQVTLLAMSRTALLKALPSVDEALIGASSNPHYKNAADRKTFYQRLALLKEEHNVTVSQPEGAMSDEELLRLAQLTSSGDEGGDDDSDA